LVGGGWQTWGVSGFGKAVLVIGPEALLAERTVKQAVAAAMRERPDAQVESLVAADLDAARLMEAAGGSLLASSSIVVVEELSELPSELFDDVLRLAAHPGPDLALVLVHPGGAKGRGLVDKLKKARIEVVECQSVKAWEAPRFVLAEANRLDGRCDQAAAAALVDAVGSDLRALASAVRQLLDDSEDRSMTPESVRRYFSGRAESTSFAVADDVLNGRTGAALGKLRWALATGVAPVLVTSALASGLRSLGKYLSESRHHANSDIAQVIGVPPWKVKDLSRQAAQWDGVGVGRALACVASADAAAKGAESDPGYALERMVMDVAALRKAVQTR
jgi:DNA polymerase-3 subunit delta